jgi:triacylglycerol lipase
MGGLDARYLITHLGMASRVVSLTTLGTPHRGSPFADWSVSRFERLVGPVFDWFGLSRQAFRDLTVQSCKQFNDQTPDSPNVRYFSVAGHHHLNWGNPGWGLSFSVVADVEGPNDGIVSIRSASWGEALDVWEGDHMNLVNWPQPWAPAEQSNRLPSYAALLERLAKVEGPGLVG